jgi:KTSC domain-containing protein
MQRIPVSSSSIASVGYDIPSITLEIEFLNGSTYQYFDVPENIYNELMHSGSIGNYLHSYIKGNYRFSRV